MTGAGGPLPGATERSIRFLTHSPPAPGISGDRIRVYNLMRQLKLRGWAIRIWSLVAPDEPRGFEHALESVADEVVLVPRSSSQVGRVAGLVRDAITDRALHSHWFWSPVNDRAARAWLDDLTSEALFVEQLYMYPFVPPSLRRRIVLDTQNHEAARLRVIARSEGSFGRRAAARLQIGAVDRFERAALAAVGSVLAVSGDEAAAFERVAPGRVHLVPNGVDVAGITPVGWPPDSRSLLFLGSLGYSANRDAIRHFAASIAPLLAGSGVTVTVVGAHAGSAVADAAARAAIPMTVAGYVPDVDPYFASSRAMVVPLRHGAGTRLKILEALAWGLPVVTTSIGGAGLDLVDGRHALIADEPSAFAAAVARVVVDDELWTRLSRAGRELVENRYSWSRIGDAFERAVVETGRRARTAVP